MEIFRGHFNECFSHFGAMARQNLPKNMKGRRQKFIELAMFCRVGVPSVSDWVDCESPGLPKGSVAIRLMFWLNLCGYKIIELERMDTTLRSFVELIGFGFLTPEEAADVVGFSSVNTLYDAFWNKCGYSEEKKLKMWNYWKSKKELLEQKKIDYFKNSVLITMFQKSKVSLVIKDSSFGGNNMNSRKAIVQIADGLLTLLKLSSEDSFAEFSESEVGILKELSVKLTTI